MCRDWQDTKHQTNKTLNELTLIWLSTTRQYWDAGREVEKKNSGFDIRDKLHSKAK